MTNVTESAHERDLDTPITRRPPGLVELPLLPQQESWLTIEDRFPGASTPLLHLVHRLRGPLDDDAWVRAVGAVVDRHESLRTLFVTDGDEAAQVVHPPAGLPVDRIDLSPLPAEQRVEHARALLDSRMEVAFDLRTGPLVASCLVRLAPEDHVWMLTAHHILADGVSLGVIDRELAILYRAFVESTEPELPDLAVHYADYALWYAKAGVRENQERDYWRRRLGGVPPLDLRTDHPRPARKGAPAADVPRVLDNDFVETVDELARERKSTRYMVLLAALQVLLSRWSGQTDFCVGMPVAGSARNRPETAAVVGLFNSMLALRGDLSGDKTFAEVLADVRETVFDALDNQDLSYTRVVAALGIPHDPGRVQLCQALLIHDEFHDATGMELPGLVVEDFPLAMPKIPYDLMVYTWACADGLQMRFFYDTGLFTEATVAARAAEYERILRAAVADPTTRVSLL